MSLKDLINEESGESGKGSSTKSSKISNNSNGDKYNSKGSEHIKPRREEKCCPSCISVSYKDENRDSWSCVNKDCGVSDFIAGYGERWKKYSDDTFLHTVDFVELRKAVEEFSDYHNHVI